MKKKKPLNGQRVVKTSISLSVLVNQWAEELSAAKGFENFSAYIADLIRRDRERQDPKQAPASQPGKEASDQLGSGRITRKAS